MLSLTLLPPFVDKTREHYYLFVITKPVEQLGEALLLLDRLVSLLFLIPSSPLHPSS